MSQYDFGIINPATTSGTDLAALLGNFRDALNSGHLGAGRPPYAEAGMTWIEASGNIWKINIFDGTNDVELFQLNIDTNALSSPIFNAALYLSKSGNLGGLEDVETARGNLELKGAALEEASAFATAAQGAKADAALPAASKADQPTAEAGTDNTKYMTALSTKQEIDALSFGATHTWSDVSGSRTAGTVYQNPTNRPIGVAVSVSDSFTSHLEVSNNGVDFIALMSGHTGLDLPAFGVVPPGGYYRVTVGFFTWAELS